MCKIIADSIVKDLEATKLSTKYQTAVKMLIEGSVSIEYIAQMLDLPLKDVKKLAKEYGKKPG